MAVMRVYPSFLVLTALVLAGYGVACGERSVSSSNNEALPDGSPPPDVIDAAPLPDAAVDAGPNPHVIELPPTGETEIYSLSNAGDIVTYSDWRGPGEPAYNIYYYDLRELEEHQITDRDGYQILPYVYGEEIIFTDTQFFDASAGNYQIELYHYNLVTAIETRLTNEPTSKQGPKFNRDYILYYSDIGCPEPGYFSLALMDRHTQEVSLLAECDVGAETYSISDHFAAWSARPHPGAFKKVYVHDLQAGVTFPVSPDSPGWQFFPKTDEDHVVWEDTRDGQREIYLHTFSTGEEVCLTPGGFEQAWPHLRNDIVSWCDYRYSQEWGSYGNCDIYVHELATGVGRRVTSRSDWWMPRYVDSGWIAYGLTIAGRRAKLYAHDLVGDGILTSDDHVIP
jgi:beta propeller repeat protein